MERPPLSSMDTEGTLLRAPTSPLRQATLDQTHMVEAMAPPHRRTTLPLGVSLFT